jgi:sulfatase maturation enzyme AslB (radical SAM superfamily)
MGGGEAGKQHPGAANASQFELLPSLPAYPPARLPILDTRARGTRFIQLSVRSVLNTSASTHMGFWSINPYVGCEFGCTYCYARDTHRWVVERTEQAVRRYNGTAVIDDDESVPTYRRSKKRSW